MKKIALFLCFALILPCLLMPLSGVAEVVTSDKGIAVPTPDTAAGIKLGITGMNSAPGNGHAMLLTRDYAESISGCNWFRIAAFDWSVEQNSYILVSKDTAQDYTVNKYTMIPENGFIIVADLGNSPYTNSISTSTHANIFNIPVGAKVYLTGIDLAAGTFSYSGSLSQYYTSSFTTYGYITVGDTAPSDAYTPNTSSYLATPTFKNTEELYPLGDITLSWNAVSGATGYYISVQNSTFTTNGTTLVRGGTSLTSQTLYASDLEAGTKYTAHLYAFNSSGASCISSYEFTVIETSAVNSPFAGKTVVAFGDSITQFTGWVNMLPGKIGTPVINAGIGGNTTANALARIDTDVLAHNPDLVIVNFGMNDQAIYGGTNLTPIETYELNYRKIISKIKATGAKVVLVAVHDTNPDIGGSGSPSYVEKDSSGVTYVARYNEVVKKLSEEYATGFIDIHSKSINMLDDIILYGIHLNETGENYYYNWIGDYLLEYAETEPAFGGSYIDGSKIQIGSHNYYVVTDYAIAWTSSDSTVNVDSVYSPGSPIDGGFAWWYKVYATLDSSTGLYEVTATDPANSTAYTAWTLGSGKIVITMFIEATDTESLANLKALEVGSLLKLSNELSTAGNLDGVYATNYTPDPDGGNHVDPSLPEDDSSDPVVEISGEEIVPSHINTYASTNGVIVWASADSSLTVDGFCFPGEPDVAHFGYWDKALLELNSDTGFYEVLALDGSNASTAYGTWTLGEGRVVLIAFSASEESTSLTNFRSLELGDELQLVGTVHGVVNAANTSVKLIIVPDAVEESSDASSDTPSVDESSDEPSVDESSDASVEEISGETITVTHSNVYPDTTGVIAWSTANSSKTVETLYYPDAAADAATFPYWHKVLLELDTESGYYKVTAVEGENATGYTEWALGEGKVVLMAHSTATDTVSYANLLSLALGDELALYGTVTDVYSNETDLDARFVIVPDETDDSSDVTDDSSDDTTPEDSSDDVSEDSSDDVSEDSSDDSSDTTPEDSSDDTSSGDDSSDVPSEDDSSEDDSSNEPSTDPSDDPEYDLGDVNEDNEINASDYTLVKRIVLGTYALPEEKKYLADVNTDNEINASDYTLVKRIVLGTYTVQ